MIVERTVVGSCSDMHDPCQDEAASATFHSHATTSNLCQSNLCKFLTVVAWHMMQDILEAASTKDHCNTLQQSATLCTSVAMISERVLQGIYWSSRQAQVVLAGFECKHTRSLGRHPRPESPFVFYRLCQYSVGLDQPVSAVWQAHLGDRDCLWVQLQHGTERGPHESVCPLG